MRTYWVQYDYKYTLVNDTEEYEDFDSGRFTCRKKDIKKEVENYIREEFGQQLTSLSVEIRGSYWTTDVEN